MHMPLIDEALEDFPKSEVWRVQTDGWQATQGKANFRPQFYHGMNTGFDFLNENSNAEITPEFIEEIYRSVYSHEDNYKTDLVLKKGYSEGYNAFEIFLPYAGVEAVGGVSEDGLDELIEALALCYANKNSRLRPQYGLVIEVVSQDFPIYFNPNDFENLVECKAFLLKHLGNAAGCKDECLGPKTPDENLTRVELGSFNATRAEILEWVQNDIDKFNIELARAKAIEENEPRKLAEINAINCFVRKLHQSHYFPDGNGRTFLFLLANFLLLQNGHGMKITQHPHHYAAYSSAELLQETLNDIHHFNEYKITQGKNYLSQLMAADINANQNLIKTTLRTHLSADPLIAMAQINELFIRVRDNKLVVPQQYAPDPGGLFSFFIKKTEPKIVTAHQETLMLLKEAYMEALNDLVEEVAKVKVENRIGYKSKDGAAAVLRSLILDHEISEFCNAATITQLIDHYDEATKSAELMPGSPLEKN